MTEKAVGAAKGSPLRQRMIDQMRIANLAESKPSGSVAVRRTIRGSAICPAFAGVPGAGAVALLDRRHSLGRRRNRGAARQPAFDISGSRGAERTLNPWLIGIGVEFGGVASRFDLRLSYAADDVAFGFGGGAADDPRLGYTFDVQEWAVSLGYVVPFGD